MDGKDKFNLIWTLCWFVFITILAFIFQNANMLWLLIIWIIGLEF